MYVLPQPGGKVFEQRHGPELRRADDGGPAPRAQDADVLAIVDDPIRKAFPLHEIDEVRSDVD